VKAWTDKLDIFQQDISLVPSYMFQYGTIITMLRFYSEGEKKVENALEADGEASQKLQWKMKAIRLKIRKCKPRKQKKASRT
jgi:hypothetical protein